jgi:hypothetical protein
MELTENKNFHLLAANGKWKGLTFVCLLQTETENGSLFSLGSKQYTVIDDYCFKKHSLLCSSVSFRAELRLRNKKERH